MGSVIRPVTALLLSAAILLAGNGLEGVLLPLRGSLQGFAEIEIGLIGSAYNAGLMVGLSGLPAHSRPCRTYPRLRRLHLHRHDLSPYRSDLGDAASLVGVSRADRHLHCRGDERRRELADHRCLEP